MASKLTDSKHAVAHIFNSAIAAPAIAAAWELGFSMNITDYAEQHDLDLGSLKGLASALATVHVVKQDANTHVLRNENRTGSFYNRESAAIAYACREANAGFFDPMFWKAMGETDYQIHSVPALEFAAAESVLRGLSDRLTFIQGDACALKYRDEFNQVDLLTSFLMGHDFWPRENCVATLKSLRTAFPNVRRFLLCDTARVLLDSTDKSDTSRSRHAVTEGGVPIFTLGFEFGHAMMDTFIPTIEDWEGVLEEGGWRCNKSYTFPPSLPFCLDLEPINQH
ncbi:methyltransferase MppJ [Apodospora peruviana]|uniref:Methyltransferase MppJ n=1 Tax=Apodospora peruviana TaxID=516989 RepID=A0AAE0HU80_9PEZI|nr:methyltransferase MppJ [Apodospora peruviana]